ncbi:MAG: hypothetical protein ABSA02_11565 [Trebonia sp.]
MGAADVDWGTTPWRADSMICAESSGAQPGYRMGLTPLGRYGIRNVLVSQGHTARVAGELATADAATLLDALADYERKYDNTGQTPVGLAHLIANYDARFVWRRCGP